MMEYLLSDSILISPDKAVKQHDRVAHLPLMSWLVNATRPGVVVELGMYSGDSFFAFCQIIEQYRLPAKCFTINTWDGGEHSGYYGEHLYRSILEYTEHHYGAFASVMRMSYDQALDSFSDGSIDLLSVGGMQPYELLRHTFDSWLPKLSDTSVVLLHNIYGKERYTGLRELWAELSPQYRHIGFEHCSGLGVLITGDRINEQLTALTNDWKSPEKKQVIQSLFAMAGQRLVQDARKERHEENLGELRNRIHELSLKVEQRNSKIIQQQSVIDELSEKKHRMESSSSWRLTKPVRKFSKSLRKRSRKLRSLFSGAKKGDEKAVEAFLAFDPSQGYAIVSKSCVKTTYTYFPPQKPHDFSSFMESLDAKPVFSIVVPIFNTPLRVFEKMVDSVRSQWYPRWELILVDDASTSEETLHYMRGLHDERILKKVLPENQGIAAATNAGIAAATGDYVLFLDHDDELTVDCLYELVRCIEQEEPDYIYSDEDKISEHGEYVEPHFKPDWSPDTMMSTMYVCHVSCVRRNLLVQLGGLRSQYDGCQDWDIILRLTEQTNRISHVPKVLYHWRQIAGSVASAIDAKPAVREASKRVREDALKRRGVSGSVEEVDNHRGYFRVNYHVQGDPMFSIIIPTKDNVPKLRRCVESINSKSSFENYELVIIDNGSREALTRSYLAELRERKKVNVFEHNAPFNFSELNNIGTDRAEGDILLFLNDDTEVITTDWLERMGGYAQLPHIGAVGAKLLYPEKSDIQHAGVLNLQGGPIHAFLHNAKDSPGYFMRSLLEYNWLAVTGACLMIERKKFLKVGGFDESFPVAYNDVELCLRLYSKGYYNIVCQKVELFHYESASRGLDIHDQVKSRRLILDKRHLYEVHPAFFQYDPFYNSNLHPNGTNFEFPL